MRGRPYLGLGTAKIERGEGGGGGGGQVGERSLYRAYKPTVVFGNSTPPNLIVKGST